MGVTLSQALAAKYRKRGFSEAGLCLGLGGQGIYFDPMTGQQLPLYEIAGDIFHQIMPLRLPDCFKTVTIFPGHNQDDGYITHFRPTGCKMIYNPTNGKKLDDPTTVVLIAGGEAGGGIDEDAKSSSISEERLKDLVRDGDQ